MKKIFLYVLLILSMFLTSCSSFIFTQEPQNDVETIRKKQEIARTSRNLHDIDQLIRSEDFDFSRIAEDFMDNNLAEYSSLPLLIKDLNNISARLRDNETSLFHLEQDASLTDKIKNALITSLEGDKDINLNHQTTKQGWLENIESYETIDEFTLPKQAIAWQELEEKDNLLYYQGDLFTGKTYLLFDNLQISEFKTFKNGILSGPTFFWYENGQVAMEANYFEGFLAGRFKAWSEVGDLIYDLNFDKGKFQSDLQYERDTSRELQEMEGNQGESDGEGNSGE